MDGSETLNISDQSIEPVDLGASHTADELDEKRRNQAAYDYLCRLFEVRNWLAECLHDDCAVPSGIDLEENLRCGVLLARLGHCFAPEVVPRNKIFDIDQQRFNREGMVEYRHTDNVVQWRRAMKSVRLPEIIIPETTDVYDGKNTAKTIFCLYALAVHLYRLRKGPAIRNEAGNAKFSREEMDRVKTRLKHTPQLPVFTQVGDLLGERLLLLDEATQRRALETIDLALTRQSSGDLLTSLRNPDTGLLFVEAQHIDGYLVRLTELKRRKETVLDLGEIQSTISIVNETQALEELECMLEFDSGIDLSDLGRILEQLLAMGKVMQLALPLYLDMLSQERRLAGAPLSVAQVDRTVNVANACVAVQLAIDAQDEEALWRALNELELELDSNKKSIYLTMLTKEHRRDRDTSRPLLSYIDIQRLLDMSEEEITAKHLETAVDEGDREGLIKLLHTLHLLNAHTENADAYIRRLRMCDIGQLSREELDQMVTMSNQDITHAIGTARAVIRLNQTLINGERAHAALLDLAELLGRSIRCELLSRHIADIRNAQSRSNEQKKGNGEFIRHDVQPNPGVIYVSIEEPTRIQFDQPDSINNTFLSLQQIEVCLEQGEKNFDEHFIQRESQVRQCQRLTRRFLNRRRAGKRRIRNVAATRIQRQFRRHRHRRNLQALNETDNPSLRCVRTFASFLLRTEMDYEEEITTERLKSKITQLINSNKDQENNLNEMDTKIGLLVKNRVSLEEVLEHGDRMSMSNSNHENGDGASHFVRQRSMMRKKDRETLEGMEQLMFHLQTETHLLVNLMLKLNGAELSSFVQNAFMPLFSFGAGKREQYLMTRLLAHLLRIQIQRSNDLVEFDQLTVLNIVSIVFRLLHIETTVSKEPMKEMLVRVLEHTDDAHLNTNPEEIFLSIRGHQAVDLSETTNDKDVQRILARSIAYLSDWAEKFTRLITKDIDIIPIFLRYLVKFARDELSKRFPDARGNDLIKALGRMAYRSYMKSLLLDLDAVLLLTGRKELNVNERNKLDSISKLIEFGVANKGYGDDKSYLSALNPVITDIHNLFKEFIDRICDVDHLDTMYQMDKYTEFLADHRPTLYIYTKQLKTITSTLQKYIDQVIPDGIGDDRLRQLIISCNSHKIIEPSLTLILHPLAARVIDSKAARNHLFIQTKKYIIDLLLAGCKGDTVTELIQSFDGDPQIVSEKKRLVRENVKKLTELGLCRAQDHYQNIITSIARDIHQEGRYRDDRKKQIQQLGMTVARLEEKRVKLDERLQKYAEYLDTCLANISRTSRKSSIRMDTVKAEKIVKQRRSIETIKTIKATAEKLRKKEILLKIDGVENNKRMNKFAFELSSTSSPGLFELVIIDSSKSEAPVPINFQELLQAEYEERDQIRLGGRVHFHVPHFVQYINRKFYAVQ